MLNHHSLFCVVGPTWENKPHHSADLGVEIAKLVDGVGVCHGCDEFCLGAKGASSDSGISIKICSIYCVKIVVRVIPNDQNRVLVDEHHCPHLLVIKRSHHLPNRHFFLVTFVLSLHLLRTQENFVEVMIGVHNKWRSLGPQEES